MSVRPRPLVSEVAATWAQIGAADIFSIGEHRVRVFLNYFAEDVKPAPPVYRELVDVYLKLSDPALDSTDLRVILEQLARQFPNPNDGRRLKNWVFGGEQRGVWNPPPPTNEAATLSVLVTSPWSESSLDRQGLRLSARAGALALKDATAAMRIAMEAVGTYSALGEDFLSGLAVALGWKSDLLAAVPTDLLEALLSRNDRLVFERVVWQRIPEAAVAAVSRVDLEEVTRDQFRTVFHGLLNRGRAHIQVASQLISRAPDTAMQGLIDELLWRQVNNWDDDWWRLVKANPAPTMSWLDNSATARPDEVLRVLIQLRPSDRAVLQHGTDTWLGVLGVTSTELASSDTQLIIYAFILAVGFLGTKGEPFELVKRTFQVIHDACLGDSLPQRAWRILEPHVSLRTTWWWWSDDRPYRLRLTLVEVFIRRHWPIRIFLETFHTNRLIVECLEDGRSVRSGQIFKRRVLEELRAGVASTDFDVDDVLSALERS